MMTGQAGKLHSPLFLWALALAGLGLAWAWLHVSQPMVDTIQVESIAALACFYYGLVYVPLALLALVLGSLCAVQPWRPGGAPLKWAAGALLAGAAGMAISAGLAWLNGGLVAGGMAGRTGTGLILLGALLTLVQVCAEELLFRGWLRATLRQMLGPRAAVVLAALAYAAFSMAGSSIALLPLANLLLLGLFLGFLAERSGGIAAPIAAHLGWTAVEDLLLGLNPNPGVGVFGALRDYDLLGAPLWGGSEAGLAASIGTSAVLVAFTLPLLARRRTA